MLKAQVCSPSYDYFYQQSSTKLSVTLSSKDPWKKSCRQLNFQGCSPYQYQFTIKTNRIAESLIFLTMGIKCNFFNQHEAQNNSHIEYWITREIIWNMVNYLIVFGAMYWWCHLPRIASACIYRLQKKHRHFIYMYSLTDMAWFLKFGFVTFHLKPILTVLSPFHSLLQSCMKPSRYHWKNPTKHLIIYWMRKGYHSKVKGDKAYFGKTFSKKIEKWDL